MGNCPLKILKENVAKLQESIRSFNCSSTFTEKIEGKWRKRNEVMAAHVPEEDKFMKLEQSLLPGICNAVTLELIATKLPWRTFYTLSSVSSAWRQAIQDRLVSDARVFAHSGENFVLISDTMFKFFPGIPGPSAVFLYSLINKTCHRLPPIPQVDSVFPYDCECIALDGKVYLLGGTKKCDGKACFTGESQCCFDYPHLGSKDVYVLDLAGQRQWKSCARMQEARANFRCGVKDGKIYVFGGTSKSRWVRGSEVYDPSVDAWSAITPIQGPSWVRKRVNWALKRETYIFLNTPERWWSLHNAVATIGEELIVYNEAGNLRVYCPFTDKWRTLRDSFRPEWFSSEFMAQGKMHSMSIDDICVYDIEKNEWTERHSWNSLAEVPSRLLKPGRISILAVDNEILAILERRTEEETEVWSSFLVQSKGFGTEDKHIEWEALPCPLRLQDSSMCLLKL